MKSPNIKKTIISAVLSLVFCVTLISVSVYCATMQSVEIENSITISSSQQTRTEVKVSYANGPADYVLFNDKDSSLLTTTYSSIVSKAYNVDTEKSTGPDIVFSYTNKYTYVIYKFEFDNKSTDKNSNITISILNQEETPAPYKFNDQINIYFGESTSLAAKTFNNGYGLTGSIDKGTQKTYYLVIATNTALADITAASSENFDIIVTVE